MPIQSHLCAVPSSDERGRIGRSGSWFDAIERAETHKKPKRTTQRDRAVFRRRYKNCRIAERQHERSAAVQGKLPGPSQALSPKGEAGRPGSICCPASRREPSRCCRYRAASRWTGQARWNGCCVPASGCAKREKTVKQEWNIALGQVPSAFLMRSLSIAARVLKKRCGIPRPDRVSQHVRHQVIDNVTQGLPR